MGQIISTKQKRKRQKREFTAPSVHITPDDDDHRLTRTRTYPFFAMRQIPNSVLTQTACPAEGSPTMPLLYALGKPHFVVLVRKLTLVVRIFSGILISFLFLLFAIG